MTSGRACAVVAFFIPVMGVPLDLRDTRLVRLLTFNMSDVLDLYFLFGPVPQYLVDPYADTLRLVQPEFPAIPNQHLLCIRPCVQ